MNEALTTARSYIEEILQIKTIGSYDIKSADPRIKAIGVSTSERKFKVEIREYIDEIRAFEFLDRRELSKIKKQ